MDLVILRYIEGQNTYFKRRWPGYSLPLIRTLEFLSTFEIHRKNTNVFDLEILSKVSKSLSFWVNL